MLPLNRNLYGGFWIRVGAAAVDTATLLLPTLLISFLYRSSVRPATELEATMVDLVDTSLSILVWWAYSAVLVSSHWQGTVGKKVCGLKVVDYEGSRITFARASARYLAGLMSAITFLGILMIAWTQRRQGLHDFIASTLVVRNDERTKKADQP